MMKRSAHWYSEYEYIRKLLKKHLKVDIGNYKDSFVLRRMLIRMRALNLDTPEEYVLYVKRHAQELHLLMDNLTINVSQFFRDFQVWQVITEKVFIPLIKDKQEKRSKVIKVWSAGCSRGEEPYTIAIVLSKLLRNIPGFFTVSILATDVDPDALAIAERGEYDINSLSNVPADVLAEYFHHDEILGKYVVKPHIKKMVKFRIHDVTARPIIYNVDAIFCRNLLIYLSKEVQSQVVRNLYKALSNGGYLVLGVTEFLPNDAETRKMFAVIDMRARIYRKVIE